MAITRCEPRNTMREGPGRRTYAMGIDLEEIFPYGRVSLELGVSRALICLLFVKSEESL